MKIKFFVIITAFTLICSYYSSAQISVIEDIKCNGDATGALIATPVNWGTSPYSYLWSTGDATQSIHNLSANTYTVTITDVSSNDSVFTLELNEPSPINISVLSVTPSDCDGHDNGVVQISVSGGNAPYSYLWREINFDSVYTTQNLTLVRGGNYELTVTDAWGCIKKNNVIVPNLFVIPATFTIDTNICNGALASVSMIADSADSAQYYTYNWSSTYNTGSYTTNDSVYTRTTSFLAGNYTITVTENSTACVGYYNFTINQSATPLVVTSSVVHNKCYGNNSGRIRLYINGGDPLPGYHCTWSGPNGYTSTSFSLAGLISGDYYFTIADDGSCTVSGSVRIQPLLPLQGFVSKNDISCNGNSNGTASAFYNGGSGPISYLWSNSDTIQQINNLIAGIYTLTVTDSLGCAEFDTAVINEPPALSISLDSAWDVSCHGLSNGAIWTTTIGGSGQLHYSWLLNGNLYNEITDDIINISAGNYQLNVTDSLFCTSVYNYSVPEPVPTLFTDSIHEISCNNGADGYWNITPAGIYTPYIAIFSTGDTISTDTVPSPFINGLSAGNYNCVITANNACQWNFLINLLQPLPMAVGLNNIVPVVCYGDSTGSVTLDNVHGGTPPYTYIWSNGMISNPANNLAAGIYHVTISDSKNCSIEEAYTIEQPFEPIKFFPKIFSTSCQQSEDGQVILYQDDVFWSPYINTIYLYDTLSALIDSAGTGEIIGGLSPGNFTAILINELGCTASSPIFVEKGPGDCILIPNLVTANADGFNDVFSVKGGCDYDDFKVIIFTDLGKKVFESEDCGFSWDPWEDIKASANTVFYYYIKVTENGKSYEFRNSININY